VTSEVRNFTAISPQLFDSRVVDPALSRCALVRRGWNQKFSTERFSLLGPNWYLRRRGNNRLFLLFQKGGPLSSVPAILAGGAAIMAVAGMLFFREPPSWQRLVGIAFAIAGLFLLRK
jgi:transporter family protein